MDFSIADAIASGAVSFDIEHDPKLNSYQSDFRLHGCSFCYYSDGAYIKVYLKDADQILDFCRQIFPSGAEIIAHNGKYDVRCLRAIGLEPESDPKNFCDTMIALNLIDDNRKPNRLGLKKVIQEFFGHKMMEFDEASSFGLDSPQFLAYALEDAEWELKLWQKLKPQLESLGLMSPFARIICPASIALADAETFGMKWSLEKATKLFHDLRRMRDEVRFEIADAIGEVNPDSPAQLNTLLFTTLKLPTTGFETTKKLGRVKVDEKVLASLSKKHKIAKQLLLYKKLQKQLGTYVVPFTLRALEDEKERIHPTFWVVSSTGRTRSSSPNVQNLSSNLTFGEYKANLRSCFVADEGHSLIIADQSQLELRLIAHISQDKELVNTYTFYQCGKCGVKGNSVKLFHACPECGAEEKEIVLKDKAQPYFWHGLDLHTTTCENVAALNNNRQLGKITNFAVVYSATAFTMNRLYPEASQREWQSIIDDFLQFYSGVAKWHMLCEAHLHSTGCLRDPFKRRRFIPQRERSSKHAVNQLINFGPQSGACSLMLISMNKLRAEWIKKGIWGKQARLINFVHDELVVEARNDLIEECKKDVVFFMENAVQNMAVPFRADVKISSHWGVK